MFESLAIDDDLRHVTASFTAIHATQQTRTLPGATDYVGHAAHVATALALVPPVHALPVISNDYRTRSTSHLRASQKQSLF